MPTHTHIRRTPADPCPLLHACRLTLGWLILILAAPFLLVGMGLVHLAILSRLIGISPQEERRQLWSRAGRFAIRRRPIGGLRIDPGSDWAQTQH